MRILFLIALSLLSFKTHAQSELLKNLYQFSEDVREVVLKAPGGHPMPDHEFQLNTQQSDQMKALSSWDDSMKVYLESVDDKDCDKQSFSLTKGDLKALKNRVDNRDYQIEAVVFYSDKKLEENGVARFSSDDFMKFMGQEYSNGNYRANDIYSINALKSKFNSTHPEIKLDSLTITEQEKLLGDYAEKYLGKELPKGILLKEMTYQSLKENSTNWKSTLGLVKDKLSSEQKIQLVSKLGGVFGDNYNYDRLNEGDKASGKFVKIEELLDSAKNGTPGGVCRDIALAQTQMLQELGFKNNYVVAFKTREGSHATVVTTDPITGKLVKFNYGETTKYDKDSGTEALAQDTSLPDHGLNFRIYDTSGKPVTRVPSELGQILKNTAGDESDREFNQKNFSLAKVGFSTPYVNGNIFNGKTSSGETIYGVALFKDVINTDNAKLNLGTSLSKRTGDRSLITIDQQNLFLMANSELSSPGLKLGPTETKVFGAADIAFLFSKTSETSKTYKTTKTSNVEADSESDFKVGVKNKYNSEDKKLSADNEVYVNFYPDWNNVATAEKKTLATESVTVKSGVTYNVTDDTRALIDTAIVMKKYGTSMIAKAAYEDDKRGMRYVAGVATPITADVPSFLPGGEKRVFGAFEHKSKNLIFSIEVERNLSNKSNSVGVKGKYQW